MEVGVVMFKVSCELRTHGHPPLAERSCISPSLREIIVSLVLPDDEDFEYLRIQVRPCLRRHPMNHPRNSYFHLLRVPNYLLLSSSGIGGEGAAVLPSLQQRQREFEFHVQPVGVFVQLSRAHVLDDLLGRSCFCLMHHLWSWILSVQEKSADQIPGAA